MAVENFTPALVGSGGKTEFVMFSGGPGANGNNLNVNWMGFTDIVSYIVKTNAVLRVASLQFVPVTQFPVGGTLTYKVRKNGVPIYTFPVLNGDGTAAQIAQQHVFGDGEADFAAGDVLDGVFDITNIHVNGYYTSIFFTLAYE